jgi:hypothetical protein
MIHVLDELRVRPGHLAEVRGRVQAGYEPALSDLGMTLTNTWVAPAVELLDDPTDLLLLWAVDDIPSYWQARRAALADRRVTAFWSEVTPLLAGRNRRIMVDPDDAPVLP